MHNRRNRMSLKISMILLMGTWISGKLSYQTTNNIVQVKDKGYIVKYLRSLSRVRYVDQKINKCKRSVAV